MKKQVSITVDYDVWFYHASKKTNLSKTLNEFLRFQMREEESNKEEIELEEGIKELQDRKKELDDELYKLQSALINLKEAKEREAKEADEKNKEVLENIESMSNTVKSNNMLRDML
jgi:hypothetical protein